MNKISAHMLLLGVDSVFNKLGVTYWLNYGTLLGIYRDGAFIPSDNDLDLMIKQEEWDEDYYTEFRNRNFRCPQTRAIGKRTSAFCISRSNGGLRVDVNVLSYDVSRAEYYLPEQFRRRLSLGTIPNVIAKRYLDMPNFVEFEGKLFRIPNEPEKFLADIYGEDWRTPLSYTEWKKKLEEKSC